MKSRWILKSRISKTFTPATRVGHPARIPLRGRRARARAFGDEHVSSQNEVEIGVVVLISAMICPTDPYDALGSRRCRYHPVLRK